MLKLFKSAAFITIVISVLSACSTTKEPVETEYIKSEPLRVGVSCNYPPVIFKQGDKILGVEAEFARELTKELQRPLEFVELERNALIPALLSGKVDILMSGLSITEARKVRIRFADHYTTIGQMAVMRVEDASKYNSLDSLLNAPAILGVVDGTTGHIFVKRNFPKAKSIVALSKASDSVFELKERRAIDIFVHDAPSIIWLISENEADLEGFGKLLTKEYLAWGVGLDDKEFLARVNAILSQWKKDGTLKKILDNWLPYLKKLDN